MTTLDDYFTKDGLKRKVSNLAKYDFNFNALTNIYRRPKWFGMLELLQYLVFIALVYFYNPFNVATKYPQWTTILALIVAFIYVTLFYFLREKVGLEQNAAVNSAQPLEMDFVKKILATVIFFIIFIGATKGLFWIGVNTNVKHIVTLFVSGLLVIGLFSVVYLSLKPYFTSLIGSNQPSIFLFLWKVIMYLPCLLIDVIEAAKRQLNITTNSVWILLGLEVVFISLWFVIPAVLASYEKRNGVHLLRTPVHLNQEHEVGNFETLYAPLTKDTATGTALASEIDERSPGSAKLRYNYSLSVWFYINPQPPNTSAAYMKYTPILNYGNKPLVEFNSNLQSLRVMAETGVNGTPKNANVLQEIYETKDIGLQRWNNIVINYDNGTMDVFLNGSLVASAPGISPYLKFDTVVAGSNNRLFDWL